MKQKAFPAKVCLPIKANAYGHGLIQVAQLACEAGLDYLAVSNLYEGICLRQAHIQLPILVLGPFQTEQIESLIEYDLEFSISSLFKAQSVQKVACALKKQAKVHLEIETGMNRSGSRPQTSDEIYAYLCSDPHFNLKGVYSHLAIAEDVDDPLNNLQQKSFQNWVQDKPSKMLYHLANSAALIFSPQTHYSMVRPGLISYGYLPANFSGKKEVRSAFSLKSKVSYFKVVEANSFISYSKSYRTKKQTRIATIPIGYGDGYPRVLSNRAEVLVRGRRYPIIGSICMDQLMVDLENGEAYVGDEVTLIGRQHSEEITVEEIAKLAQTIPYEILTQFNERLARFYY